MQLTVNCDGLCEPNPGHAAWAWVAFSGNIEVASDRGCLKGRQTNNVAEYTAVGKALRWLTENHVDASVRIVTDSQLVESRSTQDAHAFDPSGIHGVFCCIAFSAKRLNPTQ
jgi:ribonuclease HI